MKNYIQDQKNREIQGVNIKGLKMNQRDNKKENNLNIVKKLDIGERIRDMIYYNSKLYLYLEDTASLAEISFN